MKLLFISSVLAIVSSASAADGDRRRINGITFADQAVEALNLVHKGQVSSSTEQKLVIKKGEDGSNKASNKSSGKSSNKSTDNSKSRDNKSSSSTDKSSKSSSSSSSGDDVCGEKKNYCSGVDLTFLEKSKSSGKSSSKSKSSNKSSSSSRDSERTINRCIKACDTDRCTRKQRDHLGCDSTSASSDMVQKGQASPIQKLVWAGKKENGKGNDGKESSPADPASKTTSTKSSDGKSTSPDNKSRDGKSTSSSTTKSKSSSSKSNSSSSSGSNDRKWSGSGDDICTDAPKDWCEGSSGDGDDLCKDACNKKHSSKYCDKKHDRDRLGCDKMSSRDVAVSLRGRRA